MPWVKRNLYFIVGGVVAVALLGMAGYYFYSKWAYNNECQVKLDAAYAELIRISSLNPNPGNDKINNIENARTNETKLRRFIEEEQRFFAPIPPVVGTNAEGKVSKEEFASALRRTVDELERAAQTASVSLPQKYNFSFQAQRDITTFVPGSLEPLAEQLAEIKTICNLLFRARVNSLDSLRRLRISDDDLKGPQSDYLDPSIMSVTNDLAVMTPYEVTFRCFSGELAGVLAGFANSPNGFIVKTINVESGGAPAAAETAGYPGYPGTPGYPGYPGNPYYRGGEGGPVAPPPVAPTTIRGGLQVVLDEKQLRVTMILVLVKLLPKK